MNTTMSQLGLTGKELRQFLDTYVTNLSKSQALNEEDRKTQQAVQENIPLMLVHDIGFIPHLQKPYIKDERVEKLDASVLEITIEDFRPEMCKKAMDDWRDISLKKHLAQVRKNADSAIEHYFEHTFTDKPTEAFKKVIKKYGELAVKAKVDDYRRDVENVVRRVINEREKAFLQGKPLKEIVTIGIYLPSFSLHDSNFKDNTDQLRVKKWKKEIGLLSQATARFLDVSKTLETMDKVTAHHSQLIWYQRVATKLGKSICSLSKSDLQQHQHLFPQSGKTKSPEEIGEELVQAEMRERALAAQKISTPQKQKKKAQQKKVATKSNVVVERTLRQEPILPTRDSRLEILNTAKQSDMTLHERISRWRTGNVEEIRSFKDIGPHGEIIEHYRNMEEEELYKMRDFHNLAGLQRLISNDELRARYTFPYVYRNPYTHQVQQGVGLYATLEHNKILESGIIYVGIEENRLIYHAQFEPFGENNELAPEQMIRALDFYAPDQNRANAWMLASSCSFSFEEDVIKMEIGKKAKDRIIYRFFALDA